MTTLVDIANNRIRLGSVFDTDNFYIYKDPVQYSTSSYYAFTKTQYTKDLLLYRESDTGIKINNYTDIAKRQSLPPTIPTNGPFIENYSVNGTLDTNEFINLLLIDKPPVRTGFFQFYIKDFSFPGLITKQTRYTFYNWERVGTTYSYVQKSYDLGYGIEISKNLLYTSEYVNGKYVYTPTSLNLQLSNLTGNEEIVSTASDIDPNSYLNSIPGEPENTNNSLPINLFYISPADALRYIASYSDLISSYGTDYTKGQLDYAQSGGTKPITFDPIAYLNKYSDIRSLYGYDTYGATIHYITTGFYEGRTITGGSSSNPISGGLYDERNGSVITNNKTLKWPLQRTMTNSGSSLTYQFNGTNFYVTTSLPITSNLLYLGIQ